MLFSNNKKGRYVALWFDGPNTGKLAEEHCGCWFHFPFVRYSPWKLPSLHFLRSHLQAQFGIDLCLGYCTPLQLQLVTGDPRDPHFSPLQLWSFFYPVSLMFSSCLFSLSQKGTSENKLSRTTVQLFYLSFGIIQILNELLIGWTTYVCFTETNHEPKQSLASITLWKVSLLTLVSHFKQIHLCWWQFKTLV